MHDYPVYGFANQAKFIALQGAVLQYYEQPVSLATPWGWMSDVRRISAIQEGRSTG
ncbi:hypothetical protein [Hymenobacter mucosus]|uniref:hypothetical protein n=1 Tax=Hymenobacter mucosus TaxID=1411120 RepID=UPI0015C60EEC|nr:hypothetical protein [Hymenobacter mucosus]